MSTLNKRLLSHTHAHTRIIFIRVHVPIKNFVFFGKMHNAVADLYVILYNKIYLQDSIHTETLDSHKLCQQKQVFTKYIGNLHTSTNSSPRYLVRYHNDGYITHCSKWQINKKHAPSVRRKCHSLTIYRYIWSGVTYEPLTHWERKQEQPSIDWWKSTKWSHHIIHEK